MVGTTTLTRLSRVFGRQLSSSRSSPSSLPWSTFSPICSFSSSPLASSYSLPIPEVPEGTYARYVNMFRVRFLKSVLIQRSWTVTRTSSLLNILAQKTGPAVQVKTSPKLFWVKTFASRENVGGANLVFVACPELCRQVFAGEGK